MNPLNLHTAALMSQHGEVLTDKKLGPKARETFARLERHDRESEGGSLFLVVLRKHMEERGLVSLEELHCLYQEAGGIMDFEVFRYNASGEREYISREFMIPLFRVFGLRDADSVSPLVMAYTHWAPPKR